MEKFRKFDDSRVGVNPFVPTKPTEISAFSAVMKWVSAPHRVYTLPSDSFCLFCPKSDFRCALPAV